MAQINLNQEHIASFCDAAAVYNMEVQEQTDKMAALRAYLTSEENIKGKGADAIVATETMIQRCISEVNKKALALDDTSKKIAQAYSVQVTANNKTLEDSLNTLRAVSLKVKEATAK